VKNKVINGFYIIYDGICLFSRQYNKRYKDNHHLVSAFLSALDLFAKEISDKHLTKMVLEDDVFSFSLVNNILFVYTYDDVKDSFLEGISNEISAKFLEKFTSELKNWNGEVTIFESFKEDADNIVSMKGKSTLLEMEHFLKRQKEKRLKKLKYKKRKGDRVLLEMEKNLNREK
jgi:hypothetical protein